MNAISSEKKKKCKEFSKYVSALFLNQCVELGSLQMGKVILEDKVYLEIFFERGTQRTEGFF